MGFVQFNSLGHHGTERFRRMIANGDEHLRDVSRPFLTRDIKHHAETIREYKSCLEVVDNVAGTKNTWKAENGDS